MAETVGSMVRARGLVVRAFTLGGCALGGLALGGCGPSDNLEPLPPQGVRVEVTTIPTVVEVSWSTSRPSIGYVEYGPTPEMLSSTAMQVEAPVHRVSLLGLTPNTTYYYRVTSWADEDAGISDVSTFQTGGLAIDLPPFQVEGEGLDRSVLAPLVTRNTVVILDPAGAPVWAYTDSRGLEIQRARLSVDKNFVLYNAAGPLGAPVANSELVSIAINGSSESSTPIPQLGADFVQHSTGTLAALAADIRDSQGTQVRGDKIVEVNAGVVSDAWSTWDCFDPAVVPGENITEAWTYANALAFVESQDAYYVSLRNFSSIVKVNRATRACEWVFGTTGSTLTLTAGELFRHQSGFHVFEQNGGLWRLLVMDNDGGGANVSRVLEYEIDPVMLTATQVWSYLPASGAYTANLGEATRRPGNLTFVNWGAAGQLEYVDTSSQPVWRLTGAGAVFGYHSLVDNL